jgi:hypothetical protein
MDSYLRDTLLRMAEHPRLYAPKWSVEILNEVSRNLQAKFRLAPEKVNYLLGVMTDAFPDAMVCGYESLMDPSGGALVDSLRIVVPQRQLCSQISNAVFPAS